MHRIDTPGHVQNRFSEGNPQTGQRATVMSAAWFNDVQENLMEVLEQAGIAAVKGKEDQLYLAIVALIDSAIEGLAGGGGSGGVVPITRVLNTLGGLLEGGGTLANDLNLNLRKATPAEIAAGLLDDRVLTPFGLANSIAGLYQANGYRRTFGGFIEQWGVATVNPNGTTILPLPITFPNFCLWAGVEGGNQDIGSKDNNPFVSGRGPNSISVFSAQDSACAVNFKAIGI